jgi:hypothetical protein
VVVEDVVESLDDVESVVEDVVESLDDVESVVVEDVVESLDDVESVVVEDVEVDGVDSESDSGTQDTSVTTAKHTKWGTVLNMEPSLFGLYRRARHRIWPHLYCISLCIQF